MTSIEQRLLEEDELQDVLSQFSESNDEVESNDSDYDLIPPSEEFICGCDQCVENRGRSKGMGFPIGEDDELLFGETIFFPFWETTNIKISTWESSK